MLSNLSAVSTTETQARKVRRAPIRVGTIVTWRHRGGKASGKILRIVRKGRLKLPNSNFSLNANPDEPVALIGLLKEGDLTSVRVVHRLRSLKRKAK